MGNTAIEMGKVIGETRQLVVNPRYGLLVQVKILDVREAYGKLRYKVTPTAGSGVTWVDESSLRTEKI